MAVLNAEPQQTQLDIQLVKTLISAWLRFAVHSPECLLHTIKANSQEKKIRLLAHRSCSPLRNHLSSSQRGVFQILPFILKMINLHSCREQRDLQRALHSARKTKKKSKQPFILYTISHRLLVFGRRADRQLCQNQKGPSCKHSLLEVSWELWKLASFEMSMKQFDFLLHLMRAQRELEMGAKVKPSKNHSAEPSQCLCCSPGHLVTEAWVPLTRAKHVAMGWVILPL